MQYPLTMAGLDPAIQSNANRIMFRGGRVRPWTSDIISIHRVVGSGEA
jgi:hypothetical protein